MNHLELRDNVLRYYALHPDQASDIIKDKLEFIKHTNLWYDIVFLYDTKKYLNTMYQVSYEDNLVRLTVPEFNKSLVMGYSTDPVSDMIRMLSLLLIEQDSESPHHYESPKDGVAVFDFGCSEGIYGNMYCNDTNEYWGFDEKHWLPIIMKNVNTGLVNFREGFVTADSDLSDIKLTLPLGMIKVDVEESACDVLYACREFITKYHPMIQVACYHYHDQYKDIINILRNDFNYEDIILRGPMLFPQDQNQYYPYFRYGLVIAK